MKELIAILFVFNFWDFCAPQGSDTDNDTDSEPLTQAFKSWKSRNNVYYSSDFFSSDYDSESSVPLYKVIELSRNMFNVSFVHLPTMYKVFTWKITENHKVSGPCEYALTFEFDSKSSYLIVSQTSPNIVSIYYWSGITSPKEYTKTAARYAAKLFFLIKQISNYGASCNISRELEGLESLSLKHTLDLTIDKEAMRSERSRIIKELEFGDKIPLDLYEHYVNQNFPLKLNNLYLVKGGRIKKVPINDKWIGMNNCLVLQLLQSDSRFYPTSVWCGKSTTLEDQRLAELLGEKCFSIRYQKVPLKIIKYDDEYNFDTFKNFLRSQVPHPEPGYEEKDQSNDDTYDQESFLQVRDKAVKLIEIFDGSSRDRDQVQPSPPKYGPLCLSDVNDRKNYILESGSISGVFFIMGYFGKKVDAVNALQYVEDYLEENYSTRKIPVRIKVDLQHLFDLETLWVAIQGPSKPFSIDYWD